MKNLTVLTLLIAGVSLVSLSANANKPPKPTHTPTTYTVSGESGPSYTVGDKTNVGKTVNVDGTAYTITGTGSNIPAPTADAN